jgi:hypothetical protein
VNVSPSFGWFPVANVEVSGTLGLSNLKAGDEEATIYSVLVEPSYNLQIDAHTFGFVGLGVGAAFIPDLGTGLAVAPRIGAKFLIGRWGILTPSLSYEYTTHSLEGLDDEMSDEVALAAVSSALRVNIGYSVAW